MNRPRIKLNTLVDDEYVTMNFTFTTTGLCYEIQIKTKECASSKREILF